MTGPDLLLIVVDTLRADLCLGRDRTSVTPVIDRLARTGTVFLNSISSTSYTTPNFASILTGRYSPGHGIRCFMDTLGDVPTLPELFSSLGYATYAEVTGPLKPAVGLGRGFDEYRYRPAQSTVHSHWGEELLKRLGEFRRPWFCLLHLWAVHQPRTVPAGYDRRKYGNTLYERSVSALDEKLGAIIETAGRDTLVILTGDHGEYVPQTRLEDLADRYKAYYMRLKWMNRRFQTLLGGGARAVVSRRKKRREGGKPPESGIFQVMVPHGEHIYDHLIRTPLIINYPPLFPARTINDQFEQVDLLPTILGSLDMDPPEDIDGRNYYPYIRGGGTISPRPAYLECTYTQHRPEKEQWLIGLRTNQAKFIFAPFNDRIPPEYYDLEKDPEEKTNIAPLFAGRVEDHRRLALDYFSRRKETGTEITGDDKADMIRTLKMLGYLD